MRGAAILLGCLVAASPARAAGEAIPEFNVKAHCTAQSKTMGGSQFLLKSCLQQEQSSYNVIKSDWLHLPESIKSHCVRQAKSFLRSYFMLNACIQQEVASKAEAESFEFKR